MDADRFDTLARSLTDTRSRRAVLGIALGGLVATAFGYGEAEAGKRKRRRSKRRRHISPSCGIPGSHFCGGSISSDCRCGENGVCGVLSGSFYVPGGCSQCAPDTVSRIPADFGTGCYCSMQRCGD